MRDGPPSTAQGCTDQATRSLGGKESEAAEDTDKTLKGLNNAVYGMRFADDAQVVRRV